MTSKFLCDVDPRLDCRFGSLIYALICAVRKRLTFIPREEKETNSQLNVVILEVKVFADDKLM